MAGAESRVRAFDPTWFSAAGAVAVLVFLPVEAGLLLGAWHAPRIHAVGWWGAVLLWSAFGWRFTWGPLLSRRPVVSFGPQGVSGWILRGHTIPWSEIQDVESVDFDS